MYKCSSRSTIFVHIPKTGGTSIKFALFGIADKGQVERFNDGRTINRVGWPPHRPVRNGDKRLYSKFHFFSVVRNPWSRYVSFFKAKKDAGDPRFDGMEFDEFVEVMGEMCIDHRASQSYYIVDQGRIIVDTVLRRENLTEEFNRLMKALGLNITMPEKHFKYGGVYDYREYYSEKILKSISHRVKEDARRFGYQFGDPD